MMHQPISLNKIAHSFQDKLCFGPFSTTIYPGKKIAIIGRNGSGKSTLLKIIQGVQEPSSGMVTIPPGIVFGYVPQLVTAYTQMSGSERFNKALSGVIAKHPDVLCLDEPTNHLDKKNRAALMRMLKQFLGTLIMVSHDVELLRNCIDEIWLIDNNKVTIFSGNYDDYLREHERIVAATQEKLQQLTKSKKQMKQSLAKEQQRVAHSKKAHKNENDRTLIERMKETASLTEGRNKGKLNKQLDKISAELSEIHIPKTIQPSFHLNPASSSPSKTIVSITEGSCGYDSPILHAIQFRLNGGQRVALHGDNGSGKTTFIKAILHEEHIFRLGDWHTPKREAIGYIDQQYATLDAYSTVLDAIQAVAPGWNMLEMRKHLNAFLFSKNEVVYAPIHTLSGGERARLSLAQMAARSPMLLILDEITNNVDLETRGHIVQVLQEYPGAMIVISHDETFLQVLNIDTHYSIQDGKLMIML